MIIVCSTTISDRSKGLVPLLAAVLIEEGTMSLERPSGQEAGHGHAQLSHMYLQLHTDAHGCTTHSLIETLGNNFLP